MKKNLATCVIALVLGLAASGCYTLTHHVGNGASGNSETTERQWYALWGLIPLNDVESHEMAGSASSYTITSEITFVDFLFNLLTGWVTIYSQSVTVER